MRATCPRIAPRDVRYAAVMKYHDRILDGGVEGEVMDERQDYTSAVDVWLNMPHDTPIATLRKLAALLATSTKEGKQSAARIIASQCDKLEADRAAAVEAERARIAAMFRARVDFSSGALAEALEDVAAGVLAGETDPNCVMRDPPADVVRRRAEERKDAAETVQSLRAAIDSARAAEREACVEDIDAGITEPCFILGVPTYALIQAKDRILARGREEMELPAKEQKL